MQALSGTALTDITNTSDGDLQKQSQSSNESRSTLPLKATHESPISTCEKISVEEYDRQAVEYTAKMIADLNRYVQEEPTRGAKSTFFKNQENVQRGLPVFQGKHTRFLYDEEGNVIGQMEADSAKSSSSRNSNDAQLDECSENSTDEDNLDENEIGNSEEFDDEGFGDSEEDVEEEIIEGRASFTHDEALIESVRNIHIRFDDSD